MSFTLISGLIIILTLTATTVNAVKGHTQGLYKSLIRLSKVLVATLSAIAISFLLSNIAVDLIFKFVTKINVYRNLVEDLDRKSVV